MNYSFETSAIGQRWLFCHLQNMAIVSSKDSWNSLCYKCCKKFQRWTCCELNSKIPFRVCAFMSKTSRSLGVIATCNLLEESVRARLTEWDHYISSVGTPKNHWLQGLPPWVWVVESVHVGKWIEHGWFIATKPMSSSMLIRDRSQKRHFTTVSFILVEDLWSIAQIVFWDVSGYFLAFP